MQGVVYPDFVGRASKSLCWTGVTQQIRIDGLREFQRELRAVEPKLPRELRKANKAAVTPVAAEAQSRYRALGGVNAKVASSIKAVAQQRSAGIEIRPTRSSRRGSPPIPPFGPEFGGGLHGPGNPTRRGGHTTQFRPHAGRRGLGVYPAFRNQSDRIKDVYLRMVDEVARGAWPR